jgi:4-amino-4-deoxy-L-arabinose transferase-like glycosyltransferase
MVRGRWLVPLAPIGVGLVAATLGAWRLMPGVGFWDTAEFQTIPPILGTAHPTGYPTYVIVGWLASIALGPFGEAAFRMNLLSAICVGVAAAITVDLVRMLTRSRFIGVVAGLGLASTPIVWAIGTRADPHSLHLAFVAGILWLLVRWERVRFEDPARSNRWLVAVAAVTGLSAGNHSLTLLLGLPIALYVLAVEPRILRRVRPVAACVAAFAIATVLVYLELPIRGGAIPALQASLVYGRPDTLSGFAYVVTGEQFRGDLNDPFGHPIGKVIELLGMAIREFGPLVPLIVAGFVVTAMRFPAFALLSGTATFLTCFFNAAYVNADIGRYYLGPALIAWTWLAILAGATVDRLLERPSSGDPPARSPGYDGRPVPEGPAGPRPARRGGLGADPLRLAATAFTGLVLLGPTIAAFPVRAMAVDRTSDREAQQWLDAVLGDLKPDAVVVSWWSYSTPLWYAQQLEGRRRDIFVADDRTRLDLNLGDVTDVIDGSLANQRPVYVIRADPLELARLAARYSLTSLASPFAKDVFQVTSRGSAGAPP